MFGIKLVFEVYLFVENYYTLKNYCSLSGLSPTYSLSDGLKNHWHTSRNVRCWLLSKRLLSWNLLEKLEQIHV